MFVELAKIGHVGRTADHFKVAQPYLTHSIGQLEQHVGQVLFVRQSKGMSLTKAGHELEGFAGSLLAQIDGFSFAADSDLAGAKLPKVATRIGLSKLLAPIVMPRLLIEFASHVPSGRMVFLEDDDATLCDATARGEIDVCLTCNTTRLKELLSRTLFETKLVYVAPSKWTHIDFSERKTLAELVKQALVLPSKKSGVHRALSKEISRYSIASTMILDEISVESTKAIVAAGLAATITIKELFKNEAMLGRVQCLDISHPSVPIAVYLSIAKASDLVPTNDILDQISLAVMDSF